MTATRILVERAERRLAAAGIGNARTEVGWLLRAATGRPEVTALGAPLTEQQRAAFEEAVSRRSRREPLQHIVGRAPFRYLDLRVGAGVFIPRPETELLVELVLAEIAQQEAPVVVDLCSGCGAIALAVATEAPAALVTALERSSSALSWLRTNLGDQPPHVQARVRPVQADVTQAGARHALAGLAGAVDVVVVNPPYVPTGTVVTPEVAHDPPEAVYASSDGLALIPALSSLSHHLLRAGGLLALEHSETHAGALADYLSREGWSHITGHNDLAGRARHLTARQGSA